MSAPPIEIPRRDILPNVSGRSDLNAETNRGINHIGYTHKELAMTVSICRRSRGRSLGWFIWRLISSMLPIPGLAGFNQLTA